MSEMHGLDAFLRQPLAETLWGRRTRRVSRGTSVPAGSMTYNSTNLKAPLGELEEAILIAATGVTGLTMPDRPFNDPSGRDSIMAKPNMTMAGRTAGSPDNAQGTSFFLINDSGTYFLRRLPPLEDQTKAWDPATLVARAREAKLQLLNYRIDVSGDMRDFPAYLDSNRFLSNLPGTTILFPVVEMSRQYINGLMYLLTQPERSRPTLVDDRNFYRPAGVQKWIKSGFLNKDIKVALGAIQQMRTQIEADLLIQNLFLVAEAMGLGAWIHGSISPPVILGHPQFATKYGNLLHFDYATPKWKFGDLLRWHTLPLNALKHARSQPVGLRHHGEHLIKAMCPPNYPTMSDAVDEVIASKFGPKGVYNDPQTFQKIYKPNYDVNYLKDAEAYDQEVIECVRSVCNYIFDTHGRFPAHIDAVFAPGIWLQVHHIEEEYYDTYFRNAVPKAHRDHDGLWHSP